MAPPIEPTTTHNICLIGHDSLESVINYVGTSAAPVGTPREVQYQDPAIVTMTPLSSLDAPVNTPKNHDAWKQNPDGYY